MLAEWATVTRSRDERVRAALAAGLTKHRVHVITGIGRSTIDRILATGPINVVRQARRAGGGR